MGAQDNAYKLLFSHAEMVEQLLRGFVREDWVGEVDFSTLEKRSGSFVADDLRDRHDDIIWRVRLRDSWLYVYLLIEFQSDVDPVMAVRIMTYVGLLYQDLVRTREVDSRGLLPPVLPVVLYNGRLRWSAKTDIVEMIAPGPGKLQEYRPRLKYLLVDEGAVPSEELATRNLVANLFAMERCETPKQIKATLESLVAWWKEPSQKALRRSFTIWIGRVLLPAKMPGKKFPNVQELQEIPPMLEETVKDWMREATEKGMAEGMAQGMAQGMAEGQRKIARALLRRGDSPEAVAEITGLPLSEVIALSRQPDRVSEEPAPFPAKPEPK